VKRQVCHPRENDALAPALLALQANAAIQGTPRPKTARLL